MCIVWVLLELFFRVIYISISIFIVTFLSTPAAHSALLSYLYKFLVGRI